MIELTVASGSITLRESIHRVDTEGDAASDDLDTIVGGWVGRTVTLFPSHTARTVVVKDGTGNILVSGGDFSMDNTGDSISLIFDGSNWQAQTQVAFT